MANGLWDPVLSLSASSLAAKAFAYVDLELEWPTRERERSFKIPNVSKFVGNAAKPAPFSVYVVYDSKSGRYTSSDREIVIFYGTLN